MSAVPQSQLNFRRLRATDLAEVARTEKALYEFPWSPGNFRDSLEAGYDCWGVCHGNALIGYAVLMVALDEAHLLNFAIAPEWQGQGVGRAFLAHMIDVAKGARCEIVYLEVRPGNVAARNLYRSVGFQQIAIRPNYYPASGGREDALFLGLTL